MRKTDILKEGMDTFDYITSTNRRMHMLACISGALSVGGLVFALGIIAIVKYEKNDKTDEMRLRINQLEKILDEQEVAHDKNIETGN